MFLDVYPFFFPSFVGVQYVPFLISCGCFLFLFFVFCFFFVFRRYFWINFLCFFVLFYFFILMKCPSIHNFLKYIMCYPLCYLIGIWWCGGPFWDCGLGCLLPHYGPKVLGRRVKTSLIATHLKLACVQTKAPLFELWSYAHGRWNCYKRVMSNKYNITTVKETSSTTTRNAWNGKVKREIILILNQ